MANYGILVGETRKLVDADGTQLTTATAQVQTFPDTLVGVNADATSGALSVTGKAAGSGDMGVSSGGVSVTHTVTVSPRPFDWSIGDLA